jgi:hypothetical protein
MPTYRGVVVVTHEGDVPRDQLVQHLAERTALDIHEPEIDGLQVVILWRSLVDLEGDE